ncbi:hypothetical protein NSB1T_11110 [Coprobacter fastidiosus NSB1 = JCM 33896]|nr:hypothetical protein NSB1T_11110 [Coprobacter fastidiosus NSB1 = JCM 33896]
MTIIKIGWLNILDKGKFFVKKGFIKALLINK